MKTEKSQSLVLVANPLFTKKSYQLRLAVEKLPGLPQPLSYEPWIDQPRGQNTYVMEREEERQRFLSYNYWKHVNNQRKRRGDHKGANVAFTRAMHLREYLCRLNMPLVYSIVARRRGQFGVLSWDEAISEGSTCLLRALNGYDVKFKVKFSTYAVRAILRGLMNLSIKRKKSQDRVNTVELPDVYGQDNLLPVTTTGNNEEVDALRHVIDNNLAQLTETEKAVVAMRFGLGDTDDHTLEQIGNTIGVSKERVRQIQNAAIKKLKSALQEVS